MTNSNLFKQAHRMTKLTIQPNETYRFKFGQWLVFLKTGITNMIKPSHKRINQSVSYVPVLKHDGYKHKIELPMTITRYKDSVGRYTESYHVGLLLTFIVVLFINFMLWF